MKLNKKQIDAIKYLTSHLNELEDKPRKLFQSFREYADAFLKQETDLDKEHLRRVIVNIDEWEDMYYTDIMRFDILGDYCRILRGVKKDLYQNINIKESDIYKRGVEDALKKVGIEFSKIIIQELY